RRLGRNEVGGGGATDAAFAGTSKVVAATASLPTRLVSDAQLDDMATTEFEAPRGLRPWQGTLLLTEKVSTDSVSAWFSDLIAQEALVLRGDSTQVLAAGPKLASLPPAEQEQVAKLFAGDTDGEIVMGRYNARLGKLWQKVLADQVEAAESSGWWTKFPPGSRPKFPKSLGLAVIGAGSVMAISFWQHWLRAWPAAIATAFAIPAAVTGHFYRPLLPVRSAEGSALALRAESFRRFLAASEGPHVDWAWKHGLLREYSAWAVALGAADAWGRAIANSTVPPQEAALHSAPMYPYARSSEWDQSHTRYTSSGSSGGGSSSGFSGGSVGGGGGGGSSGNW
ncbi:MAG: DUF2207 domain-containing protein, partial [Actinobacteria bacterium]|nr:DUF2207 domain-containing protein [Actinomycetota bacterium]